MKMNRYAEFFTRPARLLSAAIIAFALLLGAAAVSAPGVFAEGQTPEIPQNTVSSADGVILEDEPDAQPAYFTRVASVPANVYIPEFYQQVVNVSGMYIFTMPDGTVYKRIYGGIDDVFGWYEPRGIDNIVYENAQPIDTADDSRMYYDAVDRAELEAMERQDFSGILPPEQGVTQVEEFRGIPVGDLTFYCVAGAVLLCLAITIGATAIRANARKNDPWG